MRTCTLMMLRSTGPRSRWRPTYLGSVGGTPVTAPASGTYLERRTYDRDRGGSLNDVTVTGGPDAEVIDYEMKEEDGYRDRNFYSAIDTAYKDAEVRTRDAANRLVQVEDRFGFRRGLRLPRDRDGLGRRKLG